MKRDKLNNELASLADRIGDLAQSSTRQASVTGVSFHKTALSAQEKRAIANAAIPPTGYVLFIPSRTRDNLKQALALS